MIKKLLTVSLISIAVICFNSPTIKADNNIGNIILSEQKPNLSPEQKQLLKHKQDELKEKYLKNWKNKSAAEKQKALKAYKEELDDFCRDKFGLSYKELKDKYHHYFKKILPR